MQAKNRKNAIASFNNNISKITTTPTHPKLFQLIEQ